VQHARREACRWYISALATLSVRSVVYILTNPSARCFIESWRRHGPAGISEASGCRNTCASLPTDFTPPSHLPPHAEADGPPSLFNDGILARTLRTKTFRQMQVGRSRRKLEALSRAPTRQWQSRPSHNLSSDRTVELSILPVRCLQVGGLTNFRHPAARA